ncbi:MAG: hypothetical protein HOI70_05470, partial [Opitutae bacterium]|nr:hypothetical protein [Opitutae bacterium]
LPTGKVEALVEGRESTVLKMIEEMDGNLKDFWTTKWEEVKCGEAHHQKFEIKYF